MTATMTATGEGLLRNILLHPDDDDARLVYADWLEESGQTTRAEFIRVQVELANIREPECKTPGNLFGEHVNDCWGCIRCKWNWKERTVERCRYHVLCLRELDWLMNDTVDWFDAQLFDENWRGIGRVVDHDGSRYHGGWFNGNQYILADFRRGFVESVSCRCQDWLDHAGVIMARHPVQRVTLTDAIEGNGSLVDRQRLGPLFDLFDPPRAAVRTGWIRDEPRERINQLLSAACLTYGRRAAGLETP